MKLGSIVYVKPGTSSEGFPMRIGVVVEANDGGALVRPLWPARAYPFGWGRSELEAVSIWRAVWLYVTTTLWRKLWTQRGAV